MARRRLLAATDRIRSIPLFYAKSPEQLIVSAAVEPLQQEFDLHQMDVLSAAEYLSLGYLTGDATLFAGLYKMQSGEMLEFDPRDHASPRLSSIFDTSLLLIATHLASSSRRSWRPSVRTSSRLS